MIRSKKKGGFVLAEVVIALSVILLVTVSALTIAISSVSARIKTVNESLASDFAENLLECFKAADNGEEFLANVKFAEGVTLSDGAASGSGVSYIHNDEKHKFKATVFVDFSGEDRQRMNIEVTSDEGEALVSFSYVKGGGI